MRKVLLILVLLLTAHGSLSIVFAQDTISRNGARIRINADGSITVTLKTGKAIKLTPQAELPGSCEDGQFFFVTNVGLNQCVDGSWQALGAPDLSGYVPISRTVNGQSLESDITLDLSSYVPTSRTVNGQALSSDISISKSDVNLGSADNTSDADKPVSTAQQTALNLKANLASPSFTGTPTLPTGTIATTQSAADSSTKVATTAFVTTADNLKANLASPTFTGTPTLPTGAIATTQSAGNNTTAVATTAFVTTADNLKANLASPTFTGTPTLPTGTIAATQTSGDSSTKVATTAFVAAAVPPQSFTAMTSGDQSFSNTTFADVTGLSATVTSGADFMFEVVLSTTSNVAGGVKVAITASVAGTFGADAIVYQSGAVAYQNRGSGYASSLTIVSITAVTTGYIKITGAFSRDTLPTTLKVQFAQNASSGTPSVVLFGSTFIVRKVF